MQNLLLTLWPLCGSYTTPTNLGLSSTSDAISFDQNWHHPCPTAAGGKDLFKKSSEKLRTKFPVTTCGYSMVKIAHLDDTCLEVFLTASKPSRRLITAAKRKVKKKKGKAKKNFSEFWFLCMSKPKCHKTQYWYQESQAGMLQMPLGLDWSLFG